MTRDHELDLSGLHGDDEGMFTDSRGAQVPAPSLREALSEVLEMARGNLPDDLDVAFGDEGMDEMRRNQALAVDMLERFLAESGDLLEALPVPATFAAVEVDGDADPATLSGAIQICLACAEAALPDASTISGVSAADEFDRKVVATEVVGAFLSDSGDELDRLVAAAPTGAGRSR